MTKVAHSSTTSTDTPHVELGPRPAFPAQTPAVQHLGHDLPHIPSARTAAGSYTRETLDNAIAASADDEPVVPRIPGQRKPTAYDAIVLGQPHAWTAF
jgi:hypothetical protein